MDDTVNVDVEGGLLVPCTERDRSILLTVLGDDVIRRDEYPEKAADLHDAGWQLVTFE